MFAAYCSDHEASSALLMSDKLSTHDCAVAATATAAYDTATATDASVLQLPLKCCIFYAASTATANTASALQLSG